MDLTQTSIGEAAEVCVPQWQNLASSSLLPSQHIYTQKIISPIQGLNLTGPYSSP